MTDTPLTLARWLARIEAMHPAEIELGLGRVRQVAERLQVLQLSMPVITVAGTNGKGSTVALMAALAGHQGRRVAVYTSPHLHRFNERIRLPEGLASDQQLCEAFEVVEQARGQIPLTYFEFTTLAGLWLFARSGADLVILEVGLGGRLDAVNVVDPDVAVVTSVGLDHQDWLGPDRETIAAEKCGIARAERPLVYGEQAWPANLPSLAQHYRAIPVFAGREFLVQESGLTLTDGTRLTLPSPVPLGEDNLATALQALALAGLPCKQGDLTVAASLTLPGRCEHRQIGNRHCWLDVGHNVEAVSRFLERLGGVTGTRHLVFGMMADKPVAEVMALFAGQDVRWYLAAPAIGRAATPQQLASCAPQGAQVRCFDSVAAAMEAALQEGDDQPLLVFGSFYTVAEAREVLARQ
ncbi:folylpolyglutamate synthase / dihydrofolate synthase [Alcanivorax hongdengensis A-11-3]|uniref:Dihydrofolate synthase/folylpolyglutamate synthase n=1 Tax=Alcanivorax hongdengensis A-11-3 TaxID=1177179 RepID=L0WGB8_9GAMM|nr:folylpolyglutamate synthase/dihydrofolate synthase family protein [Alcanivorax hongdengensis]EKF74865.1 folylpolyglutamate synthase / dihydrofolate synthase [Alcanivorax hongdengensis A-11-3]